MRTVRLLTVSGLALMIAACSQEKVVQQAPPPPPPEPVKPLITLNETAPIQPKKRGPYGANISFVNSSAGTYQYILFRTTAYDETGKVVNARKSRDESAYLRVAGPIRPGQNSAGHTWTNTWNKKGVHCLDVDQVEIIFTDGSVEVASGQTLAKLNQNSCTR